MHFTALIHRWKSATAHRVLPVLACIASGIGLATTAPAAESPARKPSVIFIMVDDMGLGDVGCYGGRTLKTPNINSLAKDGMLLTNAYSGS